MGKREMPVRGAGAEAGGAPRKRPRFFQTLRLLLLMAALCAGGYLAGRLGGAVQPVQTLDAVIVQDQLTQLSELAGAGWHYTNMAQFENRSEFYGVALPFTTKRFILTYDGEIKAGVDLKDAEVSVIGSRVCIRLPEAQILSHEIDEDSVEVFDEKTSIFNPFTVEDFASFQADQKAAMEEKAVSRGLLKESREQAAAAIRALVGPMLPEGWTLEIA